MPDVIEGTSPPAETKPGDADRKGPGNLTMGQAAVDLLARAEKATQQQRPTDAADEKAPETTSETSPETPAAEAPAASEPQSTPEDTPSAAKTTEARAEAAAEGEEGTVPSHISFTPEQQQIFNKRVGKEIAKTKAIQSQMEATKVRLEQLEAQLNERAPTTESATAPSPVVVLGNQPLADINDPLALEAKRQSARSALKYAERVLSDPEQWQMVSVPDPKNPGEETQIKVHKIGERFLTEREIRGAMWEAKDTVEDYIPARASFLSARAQAKKMAEETFPFLKDKTSPEYQQAEAARRNPDYAAIMAAPNADWIIGVQIEGIKAVQAREAAKKAKAETPVPKPKIVPAKAPSDQVAASMSAAPARQPIGGAERQKLAAEMAILSKKGGISPEEAVAFLQQQELLRKSR